MALVLNLDSATALGLQEGALLPEYKAHEHAVAVAGVAPGWTYGLVGLGLVLGTEWGYRPAWFPGVVLVYHGISYWFWTGNRRNAGHKLVTDSARIGWTSANLLTGLPVILVAWTAC